jgi:hypothetical protein
VGESEVDDPLHFAPGLVNQIAGTPRQELATHTWSHYYCLEPGQTQEQFAADLQAAGALAVERGFRLRSIVFPRNQHNPAYAGVLREAGITCYRGCQRGRIYAAADEAGNHRWIRLSRLADAYVDMAGPCTTRWDRILAADGLCNVPASRFLRPYTPRLRALEPLRLGRITSALRHAAQTGEIFHLWWHPHNFGVHIEENLALLRAILAAFHRLRETEGMRAMTMTEVADAAAEATR